MISRPHRITFRLTDAELADLRALRGFEYKWDDSEIVRHALKLLKGKKDAQDLAASATARAVSDKSKIPAVSDKRSRRRTR